MLTITTNRRTGRAVIEEDGYNAGYHAYEQGAPTYKISMPIDDFCSALPLGDCSDLRDDELTRVANEEHFEVTCWLLDLIKTRSSIIHIIRKVDRIR